MLDFADYIRHLKQYQVSEITEHTLRTELQRLLESIRDEIIPVVRIIHEPKRDVDYGAPDFKLLLGEAIIGYVENKSLGTDLEPILKTEQISKYKKLSDNLLLTNYLDWIWIKEGKKVSCASLCKLDELYHHRFTLDHDRTAEVMRLITNFLSTAPVGIGKPKALAAALGQRGKLLKCYLYDELIRQQQEDSEGRLFGLYNTFRRMVDHTLKLEEFTDTFAQMLVYGLFMARLNSEEESIDLYNVEKFIPTSFELIHELVSFLKVLNEPNYSETRWIVEEVLAVLNTMYLPGILNALSFDKHNRSADPETAKDPYVYFYEDFLAAYDKALKKARGVYFTPPPVVNFIIRAVNDILKDTFGIAEGLADHKKVTVLDFACGTGTFLLETIRQILDQTPVAKHDLIIKEHILKNLYGFEYMIAPYTVAHLKLTQYLRDRGYELDTNERFKVFLTNTLEHFEIENERLLPALSTESKVAQGVKDNPILVITGNPPYSYVSKNTGEWISQLVRDYYYCDGKPLGERNPKGLQDDYVKFIRFAQWKIEQEEEGIVAIITNHSFLDNPTFRGMRQSLMLTFNQIYILDLHGNTKKKEKSPDGGRDENVFDIEQGVAISFFLKSKLERKIFHGDMFGKRREKNTLLLTSSVSNSIHTIINPIPQNYLLTSNMQESSLYNSFIALDKMFNISNSGVKTHRDILVIDFTISALDRKITDFLTCSPDLVSFSHKHQVATSELKSLVRFRAKDIKLDYQSDLIKPIDYRPFDTRFIYYDDRFIERSRSDFMKNMLFSNFSLIVGRQGQVVGSNNLWNLIYVTSLISDTNVFYRGGGIVFPLYSFKYEDFLGVKHQIKTPNIKPEIFLLLKSKYATQNTAEITPEAIMGYIYAVLHSPAYREKYMDFLKTDFPRIPFCEGYAVFEQMSALGWELINAHLMKSEVPKLKYPGLGTYGEKGSNEVTKVWFADKLQRLYINDTQYFAAIPEPVYEFHIGGYQVLNKFLKDRRGRILTLDEINNVEFIAKILAFTMDKMKEINDISKDWI